MLPRSFYERDTVLVAQELLGKKVVRVIKGKILSGIIVETEAYSLDDPASHAFHGQTKANRALFGQPGHAYIYFVYGNNYCLNFVAHVTQQGAGGVLIRALEPVDGRASMQKNRPKVTLRTLTNGPGKLTQALAISYKMYGVDITHDGPLYVTHGISLNPDSIHSSPRIGITKAQEKKWRFYLHDNLFVSK